jgi:ATP synthase protein I
VQNPLGDRKDWQTLAAASSLGCSVVTSLLLTIVGGVLLDRWAGTSPIFTMIGIFLGLATAGYLLYELAMLSRPDKGVIRLKKRAKTEQRDERDDEDE